MGPYGVGIPRDSTCWRFPLWLYSEKPFGVHLRTSNGEELSVAGRSRPMPHTSASKLQASGILVNFTPRLQLRGGVERIPGFMCSESRDAVSAGKTSHISFLQPRGVLQHMTFSMLSSTSTTDRAHAG